MNNEPIKLVFTSFKDSIGMGGLKTSIDKHTPNLCSYPILPYLVMPLVNKRLSQVNMERIYCSVLDNNWELIQDFITEIYELGIRQIILCDWATKEQIAGGKFCAAGVIGSYIQDKIDRDKEFRFPVELEYRDGRDAL